MANGATQVKHTNAAPTLQQAWAIQGKFSDLYVDTEAIAELLDDGEAAFNRGAAGVVVSALKKGVKPNKKFREELLDFPGVITMSEAASEGRPGAKVPGSNGNGKRASKGSSRKVEAVSERAIANAILARVQGLDISQRRKTAFSNILTEVADLG